MDRYCYGCMSPLGENDVCGHCGWEAGKQNYSHQLPAGTVLHQRYLIGKVLGQGGFGITYIGRDQILETTVAIKEFYPNTLVTRDTRHSLSVSCADDGAKERFQRGRDRFLKEARTLVKLNRVAGIVHVQNMCLENNTAYIVMEYLEGVDLKQYLLSQNRPLTAEQTLSFFRPVLHALQKVHETGMIHRDISPDNIMVLRSGNVKLLDFGAARELERREDNPTFASELVVKQGFAPIEQYRDNADLGPFTDIYALCASMYYCMTGSVPNNAPDRFLGNDNVDWKQIPGLTEGQRSGLERGLAIRAEDRPPTVAQLWDCLYRIPEEAKAKRERKAEPEAVKAEPAGRKRRKLPALIAAAVLLLVAAGAGMWYLQGRPAEPEVHLEVPPAIAETAVLTEPAEDTAPPEEAALSSEAEPEPVWKKNLLTPDLTLEKDTAEFWNGRTTPALNEIYVFYSNRPVYGSDIPRKRIAEVFFLDTLSNAPEDAWDVSYNQDRSVLAWTEKNWKYSDFALDLYIAGEGGVNGSLACNSLFYGYAELAEIHFNDSFFTEDTQDMSNMFAYCRRLLSVDLSQLNTSQVTDMSKMFYCCETMETVNVGLMDTSNVKNMESMFSTCTNLKSIHLGAMKTSQVTNMANLLKDCSSLNWLTLNGMDTSSVEDMSGMFSGLRSMTSIDLTPLNTSKATNMRDLFSDCIKANSIRVSGLDTSNVTDMAGMFRNCEKLWSIDLGNFDTSKVTDMSEMFYNCYNASSISVRSFDTSNVTNMRAMFELCFSVTRLDVSHFNTPKVRDFSRMFYGCKYLTIVDVLDYSVSSMETAKDMFSGCGNLDLQFKKLGGEYIWSS